MFWCLYRQLGHLHTESVFQKMGTDFIPKREIEKKCGLKPRGGGSDALSSARGHQLSLFHAPPTVLVITSAVPNLWLRHTINVYTI